MRCLPRRTSHLMAALMVAVTAAAQQQPKETPAAGAPQHGGASAAATRHPLDALSAAEYWTIYDVIRASGKTDTSTRFASVLLREPPKAEVLSWKPGSPMRREATVVLSKSGKTLEALVDVAGKKLISLNEVAGAQANFTMSDFEKSSDLALADSRFKSALAKRGLTDPNTLECLGLPPGYLDTPEQRGRRVAVVSCKDAHGVYESQGRPVEGLFAVVDLTAGKVLRVVDRGVVTVPTFQDFDPASLGEPAVSVAPLTVTQPAGPGFTLTGNEVRWQHWRFRTRIDPRVGVVINQAGWDENGRVRSVLYEGSLSEIFVPYMDPDEAWYTKTFLDAGEYSALGFLMSLRENVDCPSNSVYLEALVTTETGIPRRRPRMACLFEQAAGSAAWRHGDMETSVEGRGQRDLVLRSTATIGNYDYVLDWVFQQDGAIRVRVGATGMMEVKAANSRAVVMDGGARGSAVAEDKYGHFVAENTVAVNHDHFINFRLDLDVDGTNNSLESDQLVTQKLPANSARKSIWVVEPHVARSERDGMLDSHGDMPAVWRVINPGVRGPLGYPTSYEIRGHSAHSLLASDDWPQIRAGFSEHQLWVTPYKQDERYAAGVYPTLSAGPEGLPTWTKANRAVENTDIVVWYTMGFHHLPRAEDWPVMPTMWHEVEIRPFDFFPKNPAMDLPQMP